MAKVYQHEYLPRSVYGNVVSLLRSQRPNTGIHVDIGCGYGAIAEPVREELGLTYVGFDIADDGLESLQKRGFEVHRIDLLDPAQTEATIRAAIGERHLASLSFLDTLEHITNGPAILRMLRSLADSDSAPLVLSVPNVTHKDLALKLLMGRWDLTEAGLLDHTHVGFYAEKGLSNLMASIGWHQQETKDWLLEHSDQKFPLSAPLLNHASPVGLFLRGLIDRANPSSIVNQFVRLYLPGQPQLVPVLIDREEPPRPFLSIVVAARADQRKWLRALLRELAQQTHQDFEVVAVLHPYERMDEDSVGALLQHLPDSLLRRLSITASLDEDELDALNVALSKVSGRYVTMMSSGDSLQSNWCAAFAGMADQANGAVLRVALSDAPDNRNVHADDGLSAQPAGHIALAPLEFEIPDTTANIAVPAGYFRDLGSRLAPENGSAARWALVTEAVLLCGLHASATLTASFRPTAIDGDNRDDHRRLRHSQFLNALNAHPLLLPAGSAAQIEQLSAQSAKLQRDIHKASEGLESIRAQNAVVSANAAALREQNSALLTNVHNLREENRKIHSDAASIRGANEALHSDLAELREENINVHGKASALSQAVEQLKARESSIESVLRQPLLMDLLHDKAPSQTAAFGIPVERKTQRSPFLSVIARTQGLRIRTLGDALMCLAGQTCHDFELLIVVHSESPKAQQDVENLVSAFPLCFRERVRVLTCTRPGRAAPLNEAVAVAEGEYIAVLDDDDLVFGHWVETFKTLSAEKPGAILRAVCARQDFELTALDTLRNRPRAISWFIMSWPAVYDAVAHLYDNHTPFMSIAFPAEAFRILDFRFDESLSTIEDWDLTTRLAMLCGVVATPSLTSVYRWWTNAESSLFVHSSEEWNSNRKRIVQRMNSQPLLLPPGSACRINKLTEQSHALPAQIAALEQIRLELAEQNRLLSHQHQDLLSQTTEYERRMDWMTERLLTAGTYIPWPDASDAAEEHSRQLLKALLQSRSWRWTRPFRKLMELLHGRAGSGLTAEQPPSSFADCVQKIAQIHASTSWRITKPIRAVVTATRGSANG